MQFGGSWTWSKSMDYNSSDLNTVSPLVPVRVWNYGLSDFDRTHVAKINYLYDVPKPNWNNVISKQVLGGWQLSGITSFVSGAPTTAGLNFVNAIDITGSASQGARINITGDAVLPKSERTFSRNFNTSVFAPTPAGSIGNSARYTMRGPGNNNGHRRVHLRRARTDEAAVPLGVVQRVQPYAVQCVRYGCAI